jgi:signal transduction histidine kinase
MNGTGFGCARGPGPAGPLAPQVAAGLGAIGRVAAVLVSAASFHDLAEHGLAEMREALDMELATLYLPDGRGRPLLHRYITAASPDCGLEPMEEVVFDEEAWTLAVAGGVPLVFHEEGSWLVTNPFVPAATSWVVLPLHSNRTVVGVVLAASGRRIAPDPTEAAVLTLIGDLLTAGITTARLRQSLKEIELERERARLAALVHDGLAQDLALATRELALLGSSPDQEFRDASFERLREAVASAHTTVRERLKDLAAPVPLGGVEEAIGEICARFESRGMVLTLQQEQSHVQLAPAAHVAVVRVLSEALTNVENHAAAHAVEVRVEMAHGQLTLTVADDGSGFVVGEALGPEQGHLGLMLMRERADRADGTLLLASAKGRGTKVTLQLPAR